MSMTPPFVPRDVFRLVVRLEAQKTHDVDTAALERQFRVPTGYATDEALEHRARAAQTTTPGPGAYDTRACWASDARASASAVFASRAPRDPFELAPLATVKRTLMVSASAPSLVLDTPPPLGSFARADRGLHGVQRRPSTASFSTVSATSPSRSSGKSFERAPRATDVPIVSASRLGPAQYSVERRWDAPTAAVFGASTEARTVVWSPARALPSGAVSDAWDASPAYAKHRRRVQRLHASPEKKKSLQQQLRPSARDRDVRTNGLDPFDWLRRQPHGAQRANALAAKHGLVDCVRSAETEEPTGAVAETAEATTVARPHHDHHDDDVATDAAAPQHWHANVSTTSTTASQLALSCRLPGGLVVSVRIAPTRHVRQLKAAVVRQQSRFQRDDQFDVYAANGTQLQPLDATLAACGVRDRALLQVVPR